MQEQIKKVAAFHRVFKQTQADEPTLIPEDDFILRHKLMSEENQEYIEACWNGDIVEIADALGDQLYILCGTILKHGMQYKIEEVFNEIHESNMSKLDEMGLPILREDGKIMKGNSYFKPALHRFFYK
jgi:predicted HAD superfamily Cof-like phosphohydrolase